LSDDIGHLPLSKTAVLKSVTTLVSSDEKLPDFREGYNNWKEVFDSKKEGVFSIIVSDTANRRLVRSLKKRFLSVELSAASLRIFL